MCFDAGTVDISAVTYHLGDVGHTGSRSGQQVTPGDVTDAEARLVQALDQVHAISPEGVVLVRLGSKHAAQAETGDQLDVRFNELAELCGHALGRLTEGEGLHRVDIKELKSHQSAIPAVNPCFAAITYDADEDDGEDHVKLVL